MSNRNTILPVWITTNAAIAAILGFAIYYGKLDMYLVDETGLVWFIAGTAALFLLQSGWSAWKLSSLYKEYFYLDTAAAREAYTELLGSLLSIPRQAGSILLLLGFLGTLVGIGFAVRDIDPSIAGDSQASRAIVVALVSGLGTAINTTLVGIIGFIWSFINKNILESYASTLYRRTLGG